MTSDDAKREPERVAVISLHTSPNDQPGTGDSGGMNVYIREVAERLAEQGVAVDVYTRCAGRGVDDVEEVAPGARVIQVQAGPCAPVPKEELPRVLPEFLGRIVALAADDDEASHGHPPYDVVHSHYWLSGWVGSRVKEIWGVPHVASFHTLGKVKNLAASDGADPEPAIRLTGEERVVERADRILSPTATEAAELVDMYGADPRRIRVIPPGVDLELFRPRPKAAAKRRLRVGSKRLLLFVGRLQPFKGPDVAIAALGEAVRAAPATMRDVVLAVVGGPTGASPTGEVDRLAGLAASYGVADRVWFYPPQPHDRLADFYSAAEAVLVPSRSESFGLVALEAQACGAPVVAAAAGGLRHLVVDGETGFLIDGHDPRRYAAAVLRILADPAAAARMSASATARAAGFSWDATAAEVRDVYREVAARKPA